MTDEFIAETEDVRAAFIQAMDQTTLYSYDEWTAYFDRWLAEYTRQQREEAWYEGQLNGEFYLNPYTRAES